MIVVDCGVDLRGLFVGLGLGKSGRTRRGASERGDEL